MAALGADSIRVYGDLGAEFNEHPVLTATTIYKGSAVGSSGGYARACVAQDLFLGFAEEQVINAGASGAKNVTVKSKGLIQAAVTGASVASINLIVYMSSDNDFTLTSTTNTKIGVVHRFVTGTTCIIRFDASVLI